MMKTAAARTPVAWAGILAALAALTVHPGTQVKLGHAFLSLEEGSGVVVGTALFALRQNGVLLSEAAVAAVEPIARGRLFVDERGSSTGVAISNAGNGAVDLDLTLRDSAGNQVGEIESRRLEAGENLAEFVSQLFPAVEAGFTGSLTFQTRAGSASLAAVTLRVGTNLDGDPIFATLPVADLDAAPGGGSLIFPHLGAGSILSTQIILINPSDQQIDGQVALIESGGGPLELEVAGSSTSELAFSLAPNGTQTFDLTSSTGIQQGYAVVTSSSGPLPSGTAIFRFTSGGASISEAGVGAITPTRNARIFVDNVGTQTGVALANPNPNAVTVDLELADRNGFPIATAEVVLPAGGHTSRFAHELFSDLPTGFTGVLEITSPRAVVPITLKLTTNELGRLILTTLPLADLDAPGTARLLVFPRIGFALGVSTRLILISGDGGMASGTLTFLDQGGSVLSLELDSGSTGQLDFALNAGAATQIRPEDPVTASAIVVDPFDPGAAELTVVAGERLQLRPYVLDGEEARDDVQFQFLSLDETVATVGPDGTIRGLQPGFTTLTIAAGGLVEAVPLSVISINSGTAGFEVSGVVADLAQHLYLTNSRDHTVLLVENLEAEPEVYAGTPAMAGFRDALRNMALFDEPAFLALDQAAGVLYLSDAANHRIRHITPGAQGQVITLAGTGETGNRDGDLVGAEFNQPQGLALDESGRLWVVDSGNHTIRRIDLEAGTIETMAGRPGTPGLRDGLGEDALFDSPVGIALEVESLASQLDRELNGLPPPSTRVLVADAGNDAIRRVHEDGTVETLGLTLPAATRERSTSAAGPAFESPAGIASDPLGNVYVSEPGSGRVLIMLENGQVLPLVQRGRFAFPRGLAVADGGRVLVADGANLAQEIVFGPPQIQELDPVQVSTQGDETVLIEGRNFAPGSLVLLGGRRIDATVRDSRTISFQTPVLPSGRFTLTVLNRGGIAQTSLDVEPPSLDELPAGSITTFAGGSTFAGEGLPLLRISIDPSDATVDQEGNLYIADAINNRIRRSNPTTRTATTIAGTGEFESSGDGGLGLRASFRSPSALALGRGNVLYIAEESGHRIRRLDLGRGLIETVAGTGKKGFGGDGGSPLDAKLASPRGLAVDAAGNLYVADTGNHRVRLIDFENEEISTVAGDGIPRYAGDGEPATQASLQSPVSLALDADGALWIADTGNRRIRRVDSDGLIQTEAGNGQMGPQTEGVPAIQTALVEPTGIGLGPEGALFIADAGAHRVFLVHPATGLITTVAGTGNPGFTGDGQRASQGDFFRPTRVLLGPQGGLTILDRGNSRIRRVGPRRKILETVGGNGSPLFIGDAIERVYSVLNHPADLIADRDGNLYFSDSGHQLVRKIEAANSRVFSVGGTGQTGFSGDGGDGREAQLSLPLGLALDNQDGLYVADTRNHRVRRIDLSTGRIVTVAGNGETGSPAEGPARTVALSLPLGLAFSAGGSLYVSATATHTVHRLDLPTGHLEIIAGDGEAGFSGDEGPARLARLRLPSGLAIDSQGRLLIADHGNHAVRRFDPASGRIETICGTGVPGKRGLNGPATQAQLDRPDDVTVDPAGNVYITDTGNDRVLHIDAQGILRRIAGNGSSRPLGDGGLAAEASVQRPRGLVVVGNALLIVDGSRNRIRAVRLP